MIEIIDKSELEQMISKREKDKFDRVKDTVESILADVKSKGDSALRHYSKEFDNVEIQEIKVSQTEIDSQANKVSEDFLEAINVAKRNIDIFHRACMPKRISLTSDQDIELGQLVVPYSKVGCYIPAGKNVYPSSVLMNVVPAQVANVKRIVMTTPPIKDEGSRTILAAAHLLGIKGCQEKCAYREKSVR